MSTYSDKALRCVTCGAEFVFTAGEQQFHASKGFTSEPRRCPACRQARRSNRSGAPARAEPTTEDGGAGGEGGSAVATSLGEPSRRRFVGTCSACGGEAIVPFEPMGNRPILCSVCYDKIRALA